MKIRIPKVLDVSKFLETKSGQELKDMIIYLGEFTQQAVQALNGKLSFADNFLAEQRTFSVFNGVETIISATNRVYDIRIRKVSNDIYYSVTSFGWKYATTGELVIKATFLGSPIVPIDIEVLIFY
jgi:hypothetical protein